MVNHSMPSGAYSVPPWTKCHSTARETRNAAPTPTMPYTAPPPGVRLPKNSVSAAEITGSSTTIHACVTNQFGSIEDAASAPWSAWAMSAPTT